MWIQKNPAGVTSLAFGADGQALYVLDTRGVITAWNTTARTQQRVHRVTPEAELGTACEGRFLVVWLRSAVHIWDTLIGAEHAQFPLEPNGFAPALDSTRRLLVAPDSQREVLTTWDIATRTAGAPLLRAEPGAADRFGAFAQTADGTVIAVHTARREIVVYDRNESRSFARFVVSPLVGPSFVSRLAFAPDGKTLAVFGFDRVALWDVPSRTARAGSISCYRPTRIAAVHPTLPLIGALNSNRDITLFSLDTGQPIRSLDFALGRSVTCVCFSPDGLTCAVGGSNKQFAVFDVDL